MFVSGEQWEEVDSLVFVEGTQSGRDEYGADGTDSQSFELSLLNAIAEIGDEEGITVLVFPAGQSQDAVQTWQQVSALTGAPREFVAEQGFDRVRSRRQHLRRRVVELHGQ